MSFCIHLWLGIVTVLCVPVSLCGLNRLITGNLSCYKWIITHWLFSHSLIVLLLAFASLIESDNERIVLLNAFVLYIGIVATATEWSTVNLPPLRTASKGDFVGRWCFTFWCYCSDFNCNGLLKLQINANWLIYWFLLVFGKKSHVVWFTEFFCCCDECEISWQWSRASNQVIFRVFFI